MGLRGITTKDGKVAALKDSIRIIWKGIGWMECETRWTVDGYELKIPELEYRLKELIRMQHKKRWVIPEKPAVLFPQLKNITFLGTETRQVGELEKKAKEGEDEIKGRARLGWKKQEDTGYGSVHSNMKLYSAPTLESLIGVKISQYCSVDMNKAGTEKNLRWMYRVVTRVIDGTWLVNTNVGTNCWGAGKVVKV